MNTVKDILINAKTLIQRGWTKEVYARDMQGSSVSFDDQTACQWCLNGAIAKSSKDLLFDDNCEAELAAYKLLDFLIKNDVKAGIVPGIGSLTERWNDKPSRTLEDVIALLDKAIAASY